MLFVNADVELKDATTLPLAGTTVLYQTSLFDAPQDIADAVVVENMVVPFV
jgi:hypothetical protein